MAKSWSYHKTSQSAIRIFQDFNSLITLGHAQKVTLDVSLTLFLERKEKTELKHEKIYLLRELLKHVNKNKDVSANQEKNGILWDFFHFVLTMAYFGFILFISLIGCNWDPVYQYSIPFHLMYRMRCTQQ